MDVFKTHKAIQTKKHPQPLKHHHHPKNHPQPLKHHHHPKNHPQPLKHHHHLKNHPQPLKHHHNLKNHQLKTSKTPIKTPKPTRTPKKLPQPPKIPQNPIFPPPSPIDPPVLVLHLLLNVDQHFEGDVPLQVLTQLLCRHLQVLLVVLRMFEGFLGDFWIIGGF